MQEYLLYILTSVRCNAKITIIYWLIAAASITFSKQKGVATKQGQLLYEGGHQTFVEHPRGGIYMVVTLQI